MIFSASLALLAAVATVAAQEDAASLRRTHGCTEFQMVSSDGCVPCPGRGFARLPLNKDCYDAFEVLSAFTGDSYMNPMIDRDSNSSRSIFNPTIMKAIDGIREDNFGPDENSNMTIGSSLQFNFGSLSTKRFVEKIVVWKRKGNDCSFDPNDYTFDSVERRLGNVRYMGFCLPIDKGEYFVVSCSRMLMVSISVRRRDSRPMTACDVPAELEVYGSRPTLIANLQYFDRNG
ncbi:hypothetical protein BOX15_Mlig032256g1 [Macrostomum lignano]|uniref:Uncharacterized protein n=2 Tax=Macrostomum lignano TaxID=282301 RepID=A0A267FCY6_9PLAT|nr:hypothetical protein BOX15_Mlig032256g1 [Macrostomum lignano]